jgi:hypothetical protein
MFVCQDVAPSGEHMVPGHFITSAVVQRPLMNKVDMVKEGKKHGKKDEKKS